MKVITIDILDGRGPVEVVVQNESAATRLENYGKDANKAFHTWLDPVQEE